MDRVKVMCNLLDHRKIKMIRKGPEGHTLVLLWLLLLAEAGKSNRGGYLMISDSLPYETRRAAASEREQQKAAEIVDVEESRRKERAETAARNAFWESLSDLDRSRYVSATRSKFPVTFASSLTTTFVETAKFITWEEALLSRHDRVGGADVTVHSEV